MPVAPPPPGLESSNLRAAAAMTPDAPERRLAEDLRHAVVVARLGRGRVLTSLRCRAGGAALVLKVHLPRARTKALDAARDEVARVRRRLADHPALAPAVAFFGKVAPPRVTGAFDPERSRAGTPSPGLTLATRRPRRRRRRRRTSRDGTSRRRSPTGSSEGRSSSGSSGSG